MRAAKKKVTSAERRAIAMAAKPSYIHLASARSKPAFQEPESPYYPKPMYHVPTPERYLYIRDFKEGYSVTGDLLHVTTDSWGRKLYIIETYLSEVVALHGCFTLDRAIRGVPVGTYVNIRFIGRNLTPKGFVYLFNVYTFAMAGWELAAPVCVKNNSDTEQKRTKGF